MNNTTRRLVPAAVALVALTGFSACQPTATTSASSTQTTTQTAAPSQTVTQTATEMAVPTQTTAATAPPAPLPAGWTYTVGPKSKISVPIPQGLTALTSTDLTDPARKTLIKQMATATKISEAQLTQMLSQVDLLAVSNTGDGRSVSTVPISTTVTADNVKQLATELKAKDFKVTEGVTTSLGKGIQATYSSVTNGVTQHQVNTFIETAAGTYNVVTTARDAATAKKMADSILASLKQG